MNTRYSHQEASERPNTAAFSGAQAAGIEGIKPAELVEGGYSDLRRKNQDLLDKGTEAFENSEILKTLRERSTANRDA